MGRRSEHTREEIKEMAIEAGRKIIDEEGYSNFSARKVARAIGYAVGTLYNVFDNYTDLVFNINNKTLDELENYMKSNQDFNLEGSEAVKNLGISYMNFARNNKNRWDALFEFERSTSEIPHWYAEKIDSVFALPVRFLMPLINNDAERAAYEARILWGAVHGICTLGLSRRLGRDSDELLGKKITSLIENYIKGLKNSN